MGALRINYVDGTSGFIDLSTALQVYVKESTIEQFTITVESPATTLNDYVVNRFETANPLGVITKTIWDIQMNVAYTAIAADPIRYGYPNLGTAINTYIQWDDEKFLAAAIDSGLSNLAEPAVLSNRTAIATQSVDGEAAELLVTAIGDAVTACGLEATTLSSGCAKAVADPGCTAPGFDFGGIYCSCGDSACCDATEITYISNCLSDVLDPIRIEWKHQYLFVKPGEESEEEEKKGK